LNTEIKECLLKEMAKFETIKVLLDILKELEEINVRIKRLEERSTYMFYGDTTNQGIQPYYSTSFCNVRTNVCGDVESDKRNKM
jgi:hypothetical protein